MNNIKLLAYSFLFDAAPKFIVIFMSFLMFIIYAGGLSIENEKNTPPASVQLTQDVKCVKDTIKENNGIVTCEVAK